MSDKRPFAEKAPEYTKRLEALNKEYDMAIVPVCQRTINASICVVQIVDANDPKNIQAFGLEGKSEESSLLVN